MFSLIPLPDSGPMIVESKGLITDVNVKFNINADFSRKVSFPIARCGDLIPNYPHLVWRRMSEEERFKRDCWDFLKMCIKYEEYVSATCKFDTKSFKLCLKAKNYTRKGYKDNCIISWNRDQENLVMMKRISTKGSTTRTKTQTFPNSPFRVQIYLEHCLKQWPHNSQFQFNIKQNK